MSMLSMATELTGLVPEMSIDYAFSCVYRSLMDVYRKSFWSFLTFESNWTSPAWETTGTVTVNQGKNTIAFNWQATAAINSIGLNQPTPVTQRQFRIGVGTIYNIWGYASGQGTLTTDGSTTVTQQTGSNFVTDGSWNGLEIVINGNLFIIATVLSANQLQTTVPVPASLSPGTLWGTGQFGGVLPGGLATPYPFVVDGIATLDRVYQEASAVGSGYTIFQCYYPSPVQDFRGWQSIRDMLNFNDLYFNKSRDWVNERDPQRTFYYIPTHVVPYQNDLNPNSPTYGWQLFEMWGPPTYVLTYQLSGYRSGFVPNSTGTNVPLVGQGCATTAVGNDQLGPPQEIGEDIVMAGARRYTYQWAMGRREYRGAGMLQLRQDSEKEFLKLVSGYRKDDRAKFDAFAVKFRRSGAYPNFEPSYNAIAGVASPGAP